VNLQADVIGILFILAGLAHFRWPRWYIRIVPPPLPWKPQLVAVSGIAEIAGGVGALLPLARIAAGWGLIALLVAVFPANIYMALDTKRFERTAKPWALYARLPLQFVLIAWVYYALIFSP